MDNFASKNLTAGQFNAIVKLLGGEAKVKQFLKRELIVIDPKLFKLNVPVWKTITIGLHDNAQGLVAALQAAEVELVDHAEYVVCSTRVASEKREIDLVCITPAQIGFAIGSDYNRICERAAILGLDKLPHEAASQLRLVYLDQPIDDGVVVATAMPFGTHYLLELIRYTDGTLMMRALCGDENMRNPFIKADEVLVFKLPRAGEPREFVMPIVHDYDEELGE